MKDQWEEPGDDARWFRRFRLPDAEVTAVRDQVAGLRSAVAADEPAPDDLLSDLLELAWALTPLGQEAEAARFGQRAVELARTTGEAALEIEALLHTATAVQYSGGPEEADRLFDEAIRRVAETGETDQLHYLLHHQGRLKAEAGDIETARDRFERALQLREQLGDDAAIRSTRTALAELDAWSRQQRPASD